MDARQQRGAEIVAKDRGRIRRTQAGWLVPSQSGPGKYAVTITGEIAMWQTKGFCPICGCHILNRPETLPGLAGIPVGAFRDPAFARPDRFFWWQNKHKWVTLPPDLPTIETM